MLACFRSSLRFQLSCRYAYGKSAYHAPDERYGLGIVRFNTPYGTAYGHTGSTSSYNCFLWHWPDTGASLAIGYHTDGDEEMWSARKAFRQSVMRQIFE